MSMDRCSKCDRLIDTDYYVEGYDPDTDELLCSVCLDEKVRSQSDDNPGDGCIEAAEAILDQMRAGITNTPKEEFEGWDKGVKAAAECIKQTAVTPALAQHKQAVAELRNKLDDLLASIEGMMTDSYCEFCDRHAPKDDDGRVIGPIGHQGDCVWVLAHAASDRCRHLADDAGEKT